MTRPRRRQGNHAIGLPPHKGSGVMLNHLHDTAGVRAPSAAAPRAVSTARASRTWPRLATPPTAATAHVAGLVHTARTAATAGAAPAVTMPPAATTARRAMGTVSAALQRWITQTMARAGTAAALATTPADAVSSRRVMRHTAVPVPRMATALASCVAEATACLPAAQVTSTWTARFRAVGFSASLGSARVTTARLQTTRRASSAPTKCAVPVEPAQPKIHRWHSSSATHVNAAKAAAGSIAK